MSGITDSSKFNENSTYFIPFSGATTAGVLSLNGQAGTVSVTSSDNSVGVVASPATVNLSTAGKAIAPTSVAATGAITGASTLTMTGLATFNGGATIVAPFITPSRGQAITLTTAQSQSVTWDGQKTLILSLPVTNQTSGGAVVNIVVPSDFVSSANYAGRQIANILINASNAEATYTWNLVRGTTTTQLFQHTTGTGNAPNTILVQSLTQGLVAYSNFAVAYGNQPVTVG